MNRISTFDFAPGLPLRSMSIDGDLWFVAKDVCDGLGIRTDNAIRGLDEDEKSNTQIEGFARGAILVNESGLYSFIMRSRMAGAKLFKRWVTGTVLPTLRRDRMYVAGQERALAADISEGELLARMEALQERLDAIKAAKLAEFKTMCRERDADRHYALKAVRRIQRRGRSHPGAGR